MYVLMQKEKRKKDLYYCTQIEQYRFGRMFDWHLSQISKIFEFGYVGLKGAQYVYTVLAMKCSCKSSHFTSIASFHRI